MLDRRRRLLLVPFLFLFLIAAKQRAVAPHLPGPPIPDDIFSYSEPDRIVVRHVSLDLTVDFATQTLSGWAKLDVVNLAGTNKLILDSRALDIDRVVRDDGANAAFVVGRDTIAGQSLTIDVLPSTRSVTIHYTTSPAASGLFWNTAAQSYGRVAPYLYSQNEPDDARSWIPLQDTPTVRVTYDATLRVPPGMLALMSAENPTATNETGVYTFRMRQEIPSYLIAIAVARLEFRALDERTGVYAEPELIDDAEHELQYVPEMVDVAESLLTPYPFGRYDILLMPPTYVAGGMEHVRLNFMNPFSLVSGNRPEHPLPTTLVAHELAHSWAGDLTTLGTWHDVWLNEGITSYLTLRILEEMTGDDWVELLYYEDRRDYHEYAQQPMDVNVTRLHRPFRPNEGPGVNFGFTPYTKGELFIKTLEVRIGREPFDLFLRQWFTRYAWKAVDDRAFLALLREMTLAGKPELEASLDLEEWIYESGLPENITAPTSSRMLNRVRAEVARFGNGTPVPQLDTRGWTNIEISLFLDEGSGFIIQRMAEVDAFWQLSARNTPPLSWLFLAIAANHAPADPAIERVLRRGGSNGTILTLYDRLISNARWRPKARQIFDQVQNRYYASVANQVQLMFNRFGKSSDVALPVRALERGGETKVQR